MTFFGVGFRILIVALAVLIERAGEFLRRFPFEELARHPAVARLLASARAPGPRGGVDRP